MSNKNSDGKNVPGMEQAQPGELPEKENTVTGDEELVTVRLFKDNDKYKDDVFVAVNGEGILIKRGEVVQIKRKFAKVLENSQNQDASAAVMMEERSSEFAAESKARGL